MVFVYRMKGARKADFGYFENLRDLLDCKFDPDFADDDVKLNSFHYLHNATNSESIVLQKGYENDAVSTLERAFESGLIDENELKSNQAVLIRI